MTFEEAYTIYGPDVECIAQAVGITPPEADRIINNKLNRRYAAQKDKVYRATRPARPAKALVRYAGYEEGVRT